MTRSDRMTLAITLAFFIVVIAGQLSSFASECEEVREDTFRLHILANSDSEDDQALKLKVRDTLLETYGAGLGKEPDARAAEEAVLLLRDEIEKTAQNRVRELGYDYPVRVSVENAYFDTRTYEKGVTLPAGRYEALRVVIGEGAGHNWWCVMYPPLCIPAATEDQAKGIEEKIRMLSEEPCYEPKFAVVELFESIKEKLK